MSEHKQAISIIILTLISALLFLGIFLVERQLGVRFPEIFVEEPYKPANIVVNANAYLGQTQPIWKAFAQGGEEGGGVRMFEPVVPHLKKIDAQYIRIDHIYDDSFYGVVQGRNPDNTLKLDWTKLDQTVEDILASGAKPFFSLSYMPSELAPSLIDKPSNWQDWQYLVQETVNHYSQDIEDVYYEVWNEPSLTHFGAWKMYGGKDYRILYRYAVQGAQQAGNVKPFKIGGPSIPEMDTTWLRLLFDYCIANNLRLDFISWHRYHFSPDVFSNDVYWVEQLLAQPEYSRYRNIEKLITEWGATPEKDTVYSSNVSASHALAVIRQLLGRTSYIFTFEVKDGPNQGADAWGLLTHQLTGKVEEKPRYYIYDWLAEVEGSRTQVLGEGSNVKALAVQKANELEILISNYNAWGGQRESFPITINGVKDGKYRIFMQELFKQPIEQEVAIGGNSLYLNAVLDRYSVMRIKVTRIGGR
jgi:hypothetical protein